MRAVYYWRASNGIPEMKEPDYEKELEKSGPQYAIEQMKSWFEDKYAADLQQKEDLIAEYRLLLEDIKEMFTSDETDAQRLQNALTLIKEFERRHPK